MVRPVQANPSTTSAAAAAPRGPSPAARAAAAQLVSQVFLVPLLEEMRELPFGRAIGHGGRIESAFGQQLDQQVGDRVAAQSLQSLTDSIAADLEADRGPALQAVPLRRAAQAYTVPSQVGLPDLRSRP